MADHASIASVKVESWVDKVDNNGSYWQVAAQQLYQTKGAENVTNQEIAQLTAQLQELNNNKALYDGDQMLIPYEYAVEEMTAANETAQNNLTDAQGKVSEAQGNLSEASANVSTALSALSAAQSATKQVETGEKDANGNPIMKEEPDTEAIAAAQAAYDAAVQAESEAQSALTQAQEAQQTAEGELEKVKGELETAKSELETEKGKEAQEVQKIDAEIQTTQSQLDQAEQKQQQEQAEIQAAQEVAENNQAAAKELGENPTSEQIQEAMAKTASVTYTPAGDGKKNQFIKYADGTTEEYHEHETKDGVTFYGMTDEKDSNKPLLDKDGNRVPDAVTDKDGKIVNKNTDDKANDKTPSLTEENKAEKIQKAINEDTPLTEDQIKELDVDGDGKVTVADATAAQKEAEEKDSKAPVLTEENKAEKIQKAINEDTPLTEDQIKELDVDGDGKVTVSDATAAQKEEKTNDKSDDKSNDKKDDKADDKKDDKTAKGKETSKEDADKGIISSADGTRYKVDMGNITSDSNKEKVQSDIEKGKFTIEEGDDGKKYITFDSTDITAEVKGEMLDLDIHLDEGADVTDKDGVDKAASAARKEIKDGNQSSYAKEDGTKEKLKESDVDIFQDLANYKDLTKERAAEIKEAFPSDKDLKNMIDYLTNEGQTQDVLFEVIDRMYGNYVEIEKPKNEIKEEDFADEILAKKDRWDNATDEERAKLGYTEEELDMFQDAAYYESLKTEDAEKIKNKYNNPDDFKSMVSKFVTPGETKNGIFEVIDQIYGIKNGETDSSDNKKQLTGSGNNNGSDDDSDSSSGTSGSNQQSEQSGWSDWKPSEVEKTEIIDNGRTKVTRYKDGSVTYEYRSKDTASSDNSSSSGTSGSDSQSGLSKNWKASCKNGNCYLSDNKGNEYTIKQFASLTEDVKQLILNGAYEMNSASSQSITVNVNGEKKTIDLIVSAD